MAVDNVVMTAVAFGPMQVDWEPRIDNARMRKARLDRTMDAMRRARVDYLIQLRLENVRYSLGIKRLHWPTIQLGGLAAVLTERTDPAIFIVDPDFAAGNAPWIPADRFEPGFYLDVEEDSRAFAKAVKRIFGSEFEQARVGVDVWSPTMLSVFQELFPKAEFVDGQDVMLSARQIKTEDEINCMKLAYTISEAAMQAAVDVLRPGIRECSLVGEALKKMSEYGSETTQCSEVVNSGPGSFPYRRFHTDRIVQAGDLVNMDFGANFNGYFGDFCRSFVCGTPPSVAQTELLKKAHDLQMEALSLIRPGVSPKELCTKLGREMIGHGLGISAFEGPHMRAHDDYEIRPGMTFSIVTPVVGQRGLGGVHLEDEIVITSTGVDLYSTYPYTLR